MNLLIHSYAFEPSVGGLERVTRMLADDFSSRGINVTVVTNTPGNNDQQLPYPVYRRPEAKVHRALLRRADLVWQNNITLNYLLPAILMAKLIVVTSGTPIDSTIESSRLKIFLKHFLLNHCRHVVVSRFMAQQFKGKSTVIYNPVDRKIFFEHGAIERNKDLLFVGRITPCKGLDVLVEAIGCLKGRGIIRKLTVVGTGEQENDIKQLAQWRGVIEQIDFVGLKKPDEVAHLMREHAFLVVPSLSAPAEGLGTVAAEGIACGAIPIVSSQGGLPEAVGNCGSVYPCVSDENNPGTEKWSFEYLMDGLEQAEVSRERGLTETQRREHLKKFDLSTVSDTYLQVFNHLLNGGSVAQREENLGQVRT